MDSNSKETRQRKNDVDRLAKLINDVDRCAQLIEEAGLRIRYKAFAIILGENNLWQLSLNSGRQEGVAPAIAL